jgi:hypothetical protein
MRIQHIRELGQTTPSFTRNMPELALNFPVTMGTTWLFLPMYFSVQTPSRKLRGKAGRSRLKDDLVGFNIHSLRQPYFTKLGGTRLDLQFIQVFWAATAQKPRNGIRELRCVM